MKKNSKYLIILFALLVCSNVKAIGASYCQIGEKDLKYNALSSDKIIEVRSFVETTNANDNYSTIERNTTIIGNTKFTADQIITAAKAATAGYNQALLRISTDNYYGNNYETHPLIYVYYGEVGGWYSINENNETTYISDNSTLTKLNKQLIYSVNNVQKGIYISSVDELYPKCASVGINSVKNNDGTYKFYLSSNLSDYDFEVGSKRIFIDYDSNKVENDGFVFSENAIEIVPIEESITGQAYIYINNSVSGHINGNINFYYKSGKNELITIPESGYLIPNISAIERLNIE